MTKAQRTTQKRPEGTPIKDYLNSVEFYIQRLWTLTDGVLLTCVNGEWMNENEFREKYPIKTAVNFLFRPSPDGTKFYID